MLATISSVFFTCTLLVAFALLGATLWDARRAIARALGAAPARAGSRAVVTRRVRLAPAAAMPPARLRAAA